MTSRDFASRAINDSYQFNSKLPHVGVTIFTQMSQLAQQTGAINLSQGFPDFASPPALLDALKKYASHGYQQYAPMAGLPALREQVAATIQQRYGLQLDINKHVAITPGATEAIFCAIHALVRAGDEVIVFDPCYDSYQPAVELAGGQCVHVPLSSPDFRIDWQRLADAITDKTCAIIINFPHNPTGAMLQDGDLQQLYQLIADTDIMVISDEVYEYLVFDGQQHYSVLSHEGLSARSIMIGSFGKTFHVTGWKTGYVVAPQPLLQELLKVHQYVNFCGVTPIQYALADFMQHHPQHIAGLAQFYQHKRDLFASLLAGSHFRFTPSAGTYFQLLDYSQIRPDLNDVQMADWLVHEHGIAAIPISVFYQQPVDGQRLLRFCFAKQDDTLIKACQRLQQL
jgi:methionine aminotransferase